MANVTVRNIDDEIIDRLKAQARANHRSLEGEIRHVLARQVLRQAQIDDFRERTARLGELAAGRTQTDSVSLLREDRDR